MAKAIIIRACSSVDKSGYAGEPDHYFDVVEYTPGKPLPGNKGEPFNPRETVLSPRVKQELDKYHRYGEFLGANRETNIVYQEIIVKALQDYPDLYSIRVYEGREIEGKPSKVYRLTPPKEDPLKEFLKTPAPKITDRMLLLRLLGQAKRYRVTMIGVSEETGSAQWFKPESTPLSKSVLSRLPLAKSYGECIMVQGTPLTELPAFKRILDRILIKYPGLSCLKVYLGTTKSKGGFLGNRGCVLYHLTFSGKEITSVEVTEDWTSKDLPEAIITAGKSEEKGEKKMHTRLSGLGGLDKTKENYWIAKNVLPNSGIEVREVGYAQLGVTQKKFFEELGGFSTTYFYTRIRDKTFPTSNANKAIAWEQIVELMKVIDGRGDLKKITEKGIMYVTRFITLALRDENGEDISSKLDQRDHPFYGYDLSHAGYEPIAIVKESKLKPMMVYSAEEIPDVPPVELTGSGLKVVPKEETPKEPEPPPTESVKTPKVKEVREPDRPWPPTQRVRDVALWTGIPEDALINSLLDGSLGGFISGSDSREWRVNIDQLYEMLSGKQKKEDENEV